MNSLVLSTFINEVSDIGHEPEVVLFGGLERNAARHLVFEVAYGRRLLNVRVGLEQLQHLGARSAFERTRMNGRDFMQSEYTSRSHHNNDRHCKVW